MGFALKAYLFPFLLGLASLSSDSIDLFLDFEVFSLMIKSFIGTSSMSMMCLANSGLLLSLILYCILFVGLVYLLPIMRI